MEAERGFSKSHPVGRARERRYSAGILSGSMDSRETQEARMLVRAGISSSTQGRGGEARVKTGEDILRI